MSLLIRYRVAHGDEEIDVETDGDGYVMLVNRSDEAASGIALSPSAALELARALTLAAAEARSEEVVE